MIRGITNHTGVTYVSGTIVILLIAMNRIAPLLSRVLKYRNIEMIHARKIVRPTIP
jgi:hypothetical protein